MIDNKFAAHRDGPSAFMHTMHPEMLRDYFAAKAIPALIADGVLSTHIGKAADEIADAMLAARRPNQPLKEEKC